MTSNYMHKYMFNYRLEDSVSGVCKPLEGDVVLLFANGPEIRAFNENKNEEFDVILAEKRIEAIDYDPKREMIFWADSYDKTIKRSYMVGALGGEVKIGYAQDLDMKGTSKPTAVAVDYEGDNVYWTEVDRAGSKPKGRVMIARADGRYRRALVSAGLESPTGLALDSAAGLLFWSDGGAAPKIEAAWADGSRRRPLVADGLRHPSAISWDAAGGFLYWTDSKLDVLEAIRADGTGRRLVTRGLKRPVALEVFGSHVYWLSRDSGELLRLDKFGRGVPIVISRNLLNPSAVKGEPASVSRFVILSILRYFFSADTWIHLHSMLSD